MSMKHVSDGVEWKGFQAADTRRDALPVGSLLVIAWFDGEPEVWAAENLRGVDALRGYYRKEWGDREVPFTVATVLDNENLPKPTAQAGVTA